MMYCIKQGGKEMKTCNKCGDTKEYSEYNKKRDTKDGHCLQCRSCVKKYASEYVKKNKVAIYHQHSEYRESNKEHVTAVRKEWYKKNKNKMKSRSKKWHSENHSYFREYYKRRVSRDLEYKITCNLRKRVGEAIKRQYGEKAAKTKELIGCSIASLNDHLESKFTKGMSWDNYGLYGWHIDHRRPCSSFDLTERMF
jgi:signal recognition particle GTPase